MSDIPPSRRRRWWRLFLLFCLFCVVAFACLGWYVSTDSFHRLVQRRVVAALQAATGGRVEIGEIHTIPLRLRVDVRNLTIHGRESADQVPYLHVDRLLAELKIISLFEKEIGLRALAVEHPVVHIIVYPDGSTNQPQPEVSSPSRAEPVQKLFSLSVSNIAVQRGELLWQEKRIPLDFNARESSATLNYSFLQHRYEVQLNLGKVLTRLQQYRDFEWHANAVLMLYRDHADVAALTAGSGNSTFQFSGTVQNFREPLFRGRYHALFDLAELAGLAERRDVRKGTATLDGSGSWSLRDFSTDGALLVKDLEWSDGKIRVPNARVSANYSVSAQRLKFSSVKVNSMGGELAGEVDVTGWQASLSSRAGRRDHMIGRVPADSMQRGSVRLQLSGFSLSPLIQTLSSRKFPLHELGLAGAASGNIEALWVGSMRDAETRMDLKITPPGRPLPGQLPVRGQVRGLYRASRDELRLEQFQLTTPSSEITASGELAQTSSLRFALTSHRVAEWGPLLQAAYGPQRMPFTVSGWATASGTIRGRVSDFLLNGNLEVYDFETIMPANERQAARPFHWDSLTAAVQYSNRNISMRNGSLIHGHSLLHFDFSGALVNGRMTDNSAFTLRFDAREWDADELQQVAGLNYAVNGTLAVNGHASGTLANPHGEGRLAMKDVVAYGVTVPSLESDLRVAGGELQFNNIATSVYGAPITGGGALKTSGDGFRLNVSGQNLALASFPQLQGKRIVVDGLVDFTVRGAGTAEKPQIEAHLHVKDLALDRERAGDLYVDATTEGRRLAIQARSEFDKADLKIQGTVGLQRDLPVDLNLSFRSLDVDSLLRAYLGERVTSHSLLAGTFGLRGPLRHPRELTLLGSFDSLETEFQHIQVRNVDPIRFEVADRVLRLEAFHLAGSGTDFTAHGRAQLADAREMDFRLEGTINVGLLQTLNPKISSRGTLALDVNAGGTLAQPSLEGRLQVKDAAISHNDFPSGLNGLNGALRFDQNRIEIEQLSGTTGGGSVRLTGSASYQNGAFLLDFAANARDVRLRYPPGVSSTVNADLRLNGSSSAAQLSGEVVVTKLAVTPGFDFGSYLQRSKQSGSVASSDALESRVKLDVHVTTTPELQMQTAMAKLSGNADLRVRGSIDRPVILGRAEVLEGEIFFNGTKYRLERGDVSFSNPARTEPFIDLQASTRVRDYDITVNLSGDVSKSNGLIAKWRSEPPLPEADVIALLALGRTREESAALQSSGTSSLSGEASNLLISEALNTAVSSRVQRLFGVSRIKIDPQGLASETNVVRGPQVTIEHQVASNLTITYSTNVSVASQQIIQMEYNVTRNVSIVGLRDQNGVVSFDIKIRQRKK